MNLLASRCNRSINIVMGRYFAKNERRGTSHSSDLYNWGLNIRYSLVLYPKHFFVYMFGASNSSNEYCKSRRQGAYSGERYEYQDADISQVDL